MTESFWEFSIGIYRFTPHEQTATLMNSNDSKIAILFIEDVHFICYTELRQNIEMEPVHTALKTDVARQQMSVCNNQMSSLVSSHTLDCKITGLAKLMAGKIHTTLLLTDLAKVASETSLMSPGMIAYHRPFENVSPDDEKTFKVQRIEELPRPFSPP